MKISWTAAITPTSSAVLSNVGLLDAVVVDQILPSWHQVILKFWKIHTWSCDFNSNCSTEEFEIHALHFLFHNMKLNILESCSKLYYTNRKQTSEILLHERERKGSWIMVSCSICGFLATNCHITTKNGNNKFGLIIIHKFYMYLA